MGIGMIRIALIVKCRNRCLRYIVFYKKQTVLHKRKEVKKMDMIKRPRRLRGSENVRRMVRETRMDKSSLIYPLFVRDGENIREEIPSMAGQYRYSVDQLPYELEALSKAGVSAVMLFGIPDHKDSVGSQAYAEDGVVQRALREAKNQFPNLYYITDV